MRLTLEAWYYRDDNRADSPVAVSSESDLVALVVFLATHPQPHPTVISARGLPTVGPLDDPDRSFKLDIAGEMGALAYLGPDPVVDDITITEGGEVQSIQLKSSSPWDPGMWTTLAEDPVADAPPLFIDKANRTAFPPDAVLPVRRIREALAEFAETGRRPTCVRWQDSAVF